jgi:hypothetical protein
MSAMSSSTEVEVEAVSGVPLNRIVIASIVGNALEWYDFFLVRQCGRCDQPARPRRAYG